MIIIIITYVFMVTNGSGGRERDSAENSRYKVESCETVIINCNNDGLNRENITDLIVIVPRLLQLFVISGIKGYKGSSPVLLSHE